MVWILQTVPYTAGNTCAIEQASAALTLLQDSDGDGIPDIDDLDDDNDGILDTDEVFGCENAQIEWSHNNGGGQSDDASYVPAASSTYFSSASTATFGAGLDETTDNYSYTYLLRNADALTYAAAKTANDYVAYSFVPTDDMVLTGIGLGFFTSATGNPEFNCGNFKVAIEYDEDPAFGSPQLLFQDIQIGNMTAPNGYVSEFNPLTNFVLTGATPANFRFYLYDRQNTDPFNRVRFDDLQFPVDLLSTCLDDADGDGIPDRIDPDSDNDGCLDSNEAYNDANADTNGDGTYGGIVGPGDVNPDGTVIGAGYPGTNANVITATQVSVTTPPVNQSAPPGSPATFTVVVEALSTTTFAAGVPDYTVPPATDVSATATYQWQENGIDLVDGGIYSGVNTASLTIADVTGLDSNIYNVIVTHPDFRGSSRSNNCEFRNNRTTGWFYLYANGC